MTSSLIDGDAARIAAAVAADIGADDVVIEHGFDIHLVRFHLFGFERAAHETFLFACERDEDQRLVEFVLAHDARQFHGGGHAAGVVARAGRGQFGVRLPVRLHGPLADGGRRFGAARARRVRARLRPAEVEGIVVPAHDHLRLRHGLSGQNGDHIVEIDVLENPLPVLLHPPLIEAHLEPRAVAFHFVEDPLPRRPDSVIRHVRGRKQVARLEAHQMLDNALDAGLGNFVDDLSDLGIDGGFIGLGGVRRVRQCREGKR